MTARVRIEFKRIQTYLFAVPRLRAILGANALVGETLRETLPALAVQAGGLMPVNPVPTALQGLSDGLLSVAAEAHEPWAGDDPAANWASGVLTRDGGHFQALFQDVESAGRFAALADAELTQLLPGLMVDMRVEAWGPAQSDKDLNAGWKRQPSAEPAAHRDSPMRLPRRVCELSGQGEATELLQVGTKRDQTTYQVSAATLSQWKAGERFRDGNSCDLVGRLQRARDADGQFLLPCHGDDWHSPEDLDALAGGPGRYLALVHADGNGVGKRALLTPPAMQAGETAEAALQRWQQAKANVEPALQQSETADQALQRWLLAEAAVERFYASMRQNVRAALVAALRQVFAALPGGGGARPYQLLMLGGDDLLLLCRAKDALPFVRHYAQELAQRPLSDGQPLGIGAGVAITKPSFPFHALHARCEELAASAKRLARGPLAQGGLRSVVDWAVVTASTTEALDEHRRRHDLVQYRLGQAEGDRVETLALNARPYPVLPLAHAPADGSADDAGAGTSQTAATPALADLLDAADGLRPARSEAASSQLKAPPVDLPDLGKLECGPEAARSQLKALPDRLRAGRRAGQAAFDDLPRGLRRALEGLRLGTPWLDMGMPPGPGQAAEGRWLTHLPDLVEVTEIPRLGRSPQAAAGQEAEA